MTGNTQTQAASSYDVESFMQQLIHPFKNQINQYRLLIKGLHPDIREEIKWNVPSFKLVEHFATFKLYPVNQLQIVLHRGVKPKTDNRVLALCDVQGLCKWAAADRCVITFTSPDKADEYQTEAADLITQWISQL